MNSPPFSTSAISFPSPYSQTSFSFDSDRQKSKRHTGTPLGFDEGRNECFVELFALSPGMGMPTLDDVFVIEVPSNDKHVVLTRSPSSREIIQS